MTSVYHEGEIAVQERAGVREMAARIGRGVRAALPPVAAAFLHNRRVIFAATTDARGQPWASALTGAPGFVEAADEGTVRIRATPSPGDPLAEHARWSRHAGLLAIDFRRRQRMRVNGVLDASEPGVLSVRAEEVYSNCPKYIQAREPVADDGEAVTEAPRHRRSAGLTDAQRAWIASADTFVIATAHAERGADASHRGGMPGFVRVEGDALTWGDYAGNAMFNTLGNLAVEPRAGLLFVDFERGRTLQVAGRAAIDWDGAGEGAFPGAQRLVTFRVDEAVETEGVAGLRQRLLEYSPFNPPAPDRAVQRPR